MKLNLFLLLIIFSITSFAQINPKTKWGDVTQAELDFKEVSFEKDAGAVILFEEGKTLIAGVFHTKVYRRIKILNERGIEAANQELIYYSENKKEHIEGLKAQTINYENGKIKTYAVDKNSIFDISINEAYSSKKFTFPNVKVGSIIEFEYDFYDNNIYLIDAWRFQHEFPTLFSQYSLSNETFREYSLLMVGEKTTKYSKNNNPKDINKWTLLNLSSFSSIPYLYNPADMSEGIIMQLQGYFADSKSAFKEIEFQQAISSWNDMTRDLKNHYNGFSNVAFGKEIAISIPDGKDEKQTLKNVHTFFKENYNWNNFYSIYPRKTNREIQDKKNGNSADLNLLLNSVLKGKGFQTDLVIISTRNNGKLIINYPYLGQFNNLINMVTLSDGSSVFMDASDMKLGLGFMPLQNYNHYGLILDAKSENFANLRQPISEFNSTQIYNYKDGKFLYTRSDKYNGFFQENTQIKLPKGQAEYSSISNALDVFMNEIKKDSKNAENNSRMERTMFESNPINDTFLGIENPLKTVVSYFKLTDVTRERALEFNFPFYYKIDVSIPIPDGFTAEIPSNFETLLGIPSNDLKYFQSAKIKENKIILHIEFIMATAAFSYHYKDVKAFFEKANQAVNMTLLLKEL